MGMFDYVKMPEPVNCPVCKKEMPGMFQTKDGKEADAAGFNGLLKKLDLSEIMDGGTVYHYCELCGGSKINETWVEFTVQDGKLVRAEDADHEKARES